MSAMKLIKLEMKKCNYLLCLLFAFIVFVGLYFFIIFSFSAKYDGSEPYRAYIFVLNNTMLFNKYAWTIFGSVLISKLYSEEIETRTTNILFTYPISRRRISIAKYVFIFQFIFISFTVSAILHGLLVIATNHVFPFLSDAVDMSIFPQYVLSAAINGVLSTFIMFIVLLLNTITKSSKVTIVSAIIIIVVVYQGSSSTTFFGNAMIEFAVVAAVGIICSILGIRRIEHMDL